MMVISCVDRFRIPNDINQNNSGNFGAGFIIPVGGMKIRADYGYANFEHLSDPKRFSIGFSL